MATSEKVHRPKVSVNDTDKKKFARIEFTIKDLKVTKKPPIIGKNVLKDNCKVDVKPEEIALQIDAEITNKKNDVTKYHYRANKLPGKIIPQNTKVEYEEGRVIVYVEKEEDRSWAVQLESGLDQAPE